MTSKSLENHTLYAMERSRPYSGIQACKLAASKTWETGRIHEAGSEKYYELRLADHHKWRTPRARSIQPKFQPVRPGKEDHLKRWTRFFETFLVGPNRSIEFWTEISGNFGWMDRALSFNAITMSLKTKKYFSLFYFNATANSELRIYAITRYLPKGNNSNNSGL